MHRADNDEFAVGRAFGRRRGADPYIAFAIPDGDIQRVTRGVGEFLPQAVDDEIDATVGSRALQAGDRIEQGIAREHRPQSGQKYPEQRPFGAREPDFIAIPAMGRAIERRLETP